MGTMRLLIITQKLDKDDAVLGFFHQWIEEFAKSCDRVVVICLGKGRYDFPQNVKVLSLGKEAGDSKIFKKLKYIIRFYKYILKERKNYSAVFVHMNQEYVLLGGWFWRLVNKKILFWYNHKHGSWATRIAARLAHKVFFTSPLAFTACFKNAQKMPAGIDTERFRPQTAKVRIENSVLSLGRISPVKNTDILIKALEILDEEGVNFTADIYGDYPERDEDYYNKIRKKAEVLQKRGELYFHGAVPNYKTPEIYSQHSVFVNLTPGGSFDKTILEAMACGSLVIVCNSSFKDILPPRFLFKENDPRALAEKIKAAFTLSDGENYRKGFRDFVVENHSLKKLIYEITTVLQSVN